jgi:hypothetical protein
MPDYRRIDTGQAVNSDDPQCGVWLSSSCGYWTDDWDRVRCGGIPSCPTCGCVGYQATALKWFEGAKKFESEGHPGYVTFLNEIKEVCHGRNWDYEAKYREWWEKRKEQTQ